jgi:hypothetical protein
MYIYSEKRSPSRMNDEFSGGYEKEMGKYGFENPSSIGI